MTFPSPTNRLHFRCWNENDLDLAVELWGDPDVTRFIGGPFTADWVQSRLLTELRHLHEHGIQYWPVFLTSDNAFVGCAGLRPFDLNEAIYEVGAHLRPQFWGGGYALEAAHAVIDFAFTQLQAKALFAGHHPENRGSAKLVAKLGFTPTGEQLYLPTGLMHPTYLRRNPAFAA